MQHDSETLTFDPASDAVDTVPAADSTDPTAADGTDGSTMAIAEFIADYRDSLLQAVREQNPPVYDGNPDPAREVLLNQLLRKPFDEQCPRRPNFDPPCRLNFDPGRLAEIA